MDFKTITDIMFVKKKNWGTLTNADKESMFFIFNRFMGKKYPKQSQYFNDKAIDKATAMDIWFMFLKNEIRTPQWFWKGPTKRIDPPIKDWKVVQDFYEMNLEDIYFMCEIFPDEFKEEIKRINKINLELK